MSQLVHRGLWISLQSFLSKSCNVIGDAEPMAVSVAASTMLAAAFSVCCSTVMQNMLL
jgi:hypothetical protein